MSQSLFDLSGETAVVPGGTGVLGGAMASALAAAGATIAVAGRNEARGQERVRQIEAAGGRAQFFSADAQNPESLAASRDDIIRQLGPVTIAPMPLCLPVPISASSQSQPGTESST